MTPVFSYKIQCNFTNFYVFELNALYLDESDNNLIAIAETLDPLRYWLVEIPIDQQGNCVAYDIEPGSMGVATAFSYDPKTKTLWYGYAPNGPVKLVAYDVKNHLVVKVFDFSDRLLIEDIQVTHF